MSALLEQLARRQLVWHGTQQQAAYAVVPSGYAELDKQLSGGFPASGMIDIQSPFGIGELRLLLPYLQRQQQSQRLLVLITPPAQLCADMLCSAGIELSQVVVVQPNSAILALWAAEQCLQSGCCYTVLLWQNQLKLHQARRLQLAAEQNDSALFLLRQKAQQLALPVNLSLQLQAHRQGVQVRVHKRKGGWPGSDFVVDMQAQWPAITFSEQAKSAADVLRVG